MNFLLMAKNTLASNVLYLFIYFFSRCLYFFFYKKTSSSCLFIIIIIIIFNLFIYIYLFF